MGITVKEAMTIGALRNAKLIAGENGLEREIEHVTIMEVPEAVQWLKGNDLIFASSFALAKQRSQQSNIIQAMAAANVGALVVKNQSYLDGVFNVIVDVANLVGLPVLEIGVNVDYNDIIRPLMEAVINKESAHICRKIAEMTMVDNSLEEKLLFLEHFWKMPNAVLDTQGFSLAQVPRGWFNEDDFLSIKNKPLFGGIMIECNHEFCYMAAIRSNDVLEGYWLLKTGTKAITAEKLKDIENALPMLVGQMEKQKSLDEVKTRFSSEFLEDLIMGQVPSVEIAKRRAQLLGLRLCPYYTIIVAKQKNLSAQNKEHRNFLWPVYLNMPGEVLAAVNLRNASYHAILLGLPSRDDKYLQRFSQLLCEMFASYGSEEVFLGVGSVFEELNCAGKSCTEAKEAMLIGKYFGQDKRYMLFKDMGIYRLLAQVDNDRQLLDFVPEGLLRLQAYDIHSNIDLLKTLSAYLANGGNARKTAEKLFVHYKTLQYRLDRIEEIADLDLEDGEVRLEYHIGLKIVTMLQAKNG